MGPWQAREIGSVLAAEQRARVDARARQFRDRLDAETDAGLSVFRDARRPFAGQRETVGAPVPLSYGREAGESAANDPLSQRFRRPSQSPDGDSSPGGAMSST